MTELRKYINSKVLDAEREVLFRQIKKYPFSFIDASDELKNDYDSIKYFLSVVKEILDEDLKMYSDEIKFTEEKRKQFEAMKLERELLAEIPINDAPPKITKF